MCHWKKTFWAVCVCVWGGGGGGGVVMGLGVQHIYYFVLHTYLGRRGYFGV